MAAFAAGSTVRITDGPLAGTYGYVLPGYRWNYVLVQVCDEGTNWIPASKVELVPDGVE